jgi:hypothetical protein
VTHHHAVGQITVPATTASGRAVRGLASHRGALDPYGILNTASSAERGLSLI